MRYSQVRNLTLNRKRSQRRGERALARLPHESIDVHAPSADELLGERQERAALDHALAKLPDALAELFQLRTSGLSYEEMSQVLEIPLGTIKSRMHQMVTQLREELRPWTVR
jgi:RNA polymerase sigma-70 factor (ECF subfamily)